MSPAALPLGDFARKGRVEEQDNDKEDYFFYAQDKKDERPPACVKMEGIMVDGGGVTSHIVNDIRKFESFDDTFPPDSHSVELADGTKCRGIAQRRGTARLCLLDNAGQQHRAHLRGFIHTYIPA